MVYGLLRRRRPRLQDEFLDERRQRESDVAQAQAALDPQAFDEYTEIGATLLLDDVLELLREVEPVKQ